MFLLGEYHRFLFYALLVTGIALQVLSLMLNADRILDYLMLILSIVFMVLGFWFSTIAAVLISFWFIAVVTIPGSIQQGSGFYLSLFAVGFLTTRRPPYLGVVLGVISAFALYYGHSLTGSVSGKLGMVLYLLPLIVGFAYNQLRAQKEAQAIEENLRAAAFREDLANQLHDNLSGKLVQISLLSRLISQTDGIESESVGNKIREASAAALMQLREFTTELGRNPNTYTIGNKTGKEGDKIRETQSLADVLTQIESKLRDVGFFPECVISGDWFAYQESILVLREILEEISTNIMKHALASSKVYLLVRCGQEQLRIFSANPISVVDSTYFPSSGRGLNSMKTKIEKLNGRMETRFEENQYSTSITIPKA